MPSFTSAGYRAEPVKTPKPSRQKEKKPRKKRKGPGRAAVVSVCFFLVALILSGGILYLYLTTRNYATAFLSGIYLSGESLEGMTYEQAVAKLKTLETQNLGEFTYTVECEEDAYSFTGEALSLAYDTSATLDELYLLGREENFLKRFLTIRRLRDNPVFAQPVLTYDLSPIEPILEQIRSEYTGEPVDATVSFDPSNSAPFVYTDELQGLHVDVSKVLKEVEAAVKKGTSGKSIVETETVPAAVTRMDLEANLQILARITVPITGDPGSADNAELALLQLSGRRIPPRADLSFNETVGMRTEESGYVSAPEPAYGLEVSGVGGGICQASSLLYQGALLSGLEIKERNPAAALVDFALPGEEATVSDQGLDLVVRNPTNYPVFIRCRVYTDNNIKTACLELFGQRRWTEIRLRHETEILTAPAEPVYLLDKTGSHAQYQDEHVLRNNAMDGAAVTSVRVFLDAAGVESETETLSEDRYEPLPTCYWIGAQLRPDAGT